MEKKKETIIKNIMDIKKEKAEYKIIFYFEKGHYVFITYENKKEFLEDCKMVEYLSFGDNKIYMPGYTINMNRVLHIKFTCNDNRILFRRDGEGVILAIKKVLQDH